MTYSDSVRATKSYTTTNFGDGASSPGAMFEAGYLAALAELAKESAVFALTSPPPGHSFDGLVSALIRGRASGPAAWVTAPVCSPPPPPSHEQQIAMREAAELDRCEQYFKARPGLQSDRKLRVFEAGFTRGWDARGEVGP